MARRRRRPPELCGRCGDELTAGSRARVHAGEDAEFGLCDTCDEAYGDNPTLAVLGLPNPPDELQQLSGRVIEVRYRHAEDGKLYRHEFAKGVEAWALPGGSVLLKHSDPDLRVWDDFPN